MGQFHPFIIKTTLLFKEYKDYKIAFVGFNYVRNREKKYV